MMTRRDWLVKVFGATVAATVAPLLDLTDATPAFWNQAPLKELLPWRITFPDGLTYAFNGVVTAERLLDDGTVSLTMQPIGPTKISQDISFPINYEDGIIQEPKPAILSSTDGAVVAEVEDIAMEPLSRDTIETGDGQILGLQRRGSVTFSVKFPEDR